MLRNDEIIIPPNCPANKAKTVFSITPSDCSFHVEDSRLNTTDIVAIFRRASAVRQISHIAVGHLTIPSDSKEADIARAINTAENHFGEVQMGAEICRRVAYCRGIRENGECWALGATGVKEALQQIAETSS